MNVSFQSGRQWLEWHNCYIQHSLKFDRRLELKWDHPHVSVNDIESILGLSFMRDHSERMVHSIYFDTFRMSLRADSEEGLNPRFKYRVRWYGEEAEAWRLEVKRSESQFRLKSVVSSVGPRPKVLETPFGSLRPILQISYLRHYFRHGDIRITVDRGITVRHIDTGARLHFNQQVLELKIPDSLSAQILSGVELPPTARFSKYVIAARIRDAQQ